MKPKALHGWGRFRTPEPELVSFHEKEQCAPGHFSKRQIDARIEAALREIHHRDTEAQSEISQKGIAKPYRHCL